MFCPNCHAFVNERDLIKKNVKKWDNADIEYDARCPACKEEIGRMSWGKLTIHPDIQRKIAQDGSAPEMDSKKAELPPQAKPAGDFGGKGSMDFFSDEEVSGGQSQDCPYCPHCGKDLPKDLSKLPRRKQKNW